MDNKALYKLSYGVFMLSTKLGDKTNGCITDTCIQVANSPVRIAISVMNTNYTCDLLKKSGVFALSLLDETCTFDVIKHWGFQSGRDVDKMEGLSLPKDINGISFLSSHTCAAISGKVLEQYDLGTHTLFVAEVVDAITINDNKPLTYADYQDKLKPKAPAEETVVKEKEERKIIAWKCKICNHIYRGSELPEDFSCPVCGHSREYFEPVYE